MENSLRRRLSVRRTSLTDARVLVIVAGPMPSGWAALPYAVPLDPAFAHLSATAVKVYFALLIHRNLGTGEAWPGQETLADFAGLKGKWRRKNVARAVDELRLAGFVTVRQSRDGGGIHNFYRLTHLDQWGAENPIGTQLRGAGCPATGRSMSKLGGAGGSSYGAQRTPGTKRKNKTKEPDDNNEGVAVVGHSSSQEKERTETDTAPSGVAELRALGIDHSTAIRLVEEYGPERALRAAHRASTANDIRNPSGLCISLMKNGEELEPVPEIHTEPPEIDFNALDDETQFAVLKGVSRKYQGLNIDLREPTENILRLPAVRGGIREFLKRFGLPKDPEREPTG